MANFLITLPEHDFLTDYCSKWSREIIKTAEDMRHDVKKLEGPKSNRKEFEERLIAHDPSFVMLNGHGNSREVAGHANEIILSCEESVQNSRLSRGKIFYVRACSCGSELGPSCMDVGCKSFVGYGKEFAVIHRKSKESHPLDDERAKPFFEVSNQIPIAILRGCTIAEAVQRSNLKLEKEVERLMSTDSFIASHLIPWLLWNQKILVVLGDVAGKM